MARESALWSRLRKTGVPELRNSGHVVDLQRLENAVGTGHPDVEGCVDGHQIWIELKSEVRPKRADTPIRFKLRESQSIWHRERANAAFRCHWVLAQVGEGSKANLYLIPGSRYDDLSAISEAMLYSLSALSSTQPSLGEVLLRATRGWK